MTGRKEDGVTVDISHSEVGLHPSFMRGELFELKSCIYSVNEGMYDVIDKLEEDKAPNDSWFDNAVKNYEEELEHFTEDVEIHPGSDQQVVDMGATSMPHIERLSIPGEPPIPDVWLGDNTSVVILEESDDFCPFDTGIVGRGLTNPFPLYIETDIDDNDELEMVILDDFLGFCGCGLPDDAIDALFRYLIALSQETEDYDPEQFDQVTTDQGVLTLLHYVMDSNKITEHGGSVPGWLTRKGWMLFLYVLVHRIQINGDIGVTKYFTEDFNSEKLEYYIPNVLTTLSENKEFSELPWLTDNQRALLKGRFEFEGFQTNIFD